VASTYPLAYSGARFDDATADFDATERVPADRRARARWHEKTTVVVAFGSLAVIGLAVLVIAVLTVSNDSRHPDAGRHPVVASTTPAPPPTTSAVPFPLPITADPPPTAAQPPPTETSPPPAIALQPPGAAPHPGGPGSGWQRWRHWLWAHQHPAG
jgi:hypothetical protein